MEKVIENENAGTAAPKTVEELMVAEYLSLKKEAAALRSALAASQASYRKAVGDYEALAAEHDALAGALRRRFEPIEDPSDLTDDDDLPTMRLYVPRYGSYGEKSDIRILMRYAPIKGAEGDGKEGE